MNCAIIVAAGKSERMGANTDKAFLSLGQKPVLAYSLQAFEDCEDIDAIVLVVRKDRVEGAGKMAQIFGCSKVINVIAGGTKRQASVMNGLNCLNDDARIVTVHDGARPCVTPALISETIRTAKRYGSAIAANRITDTVKYVERGLKIGKTMDRSKLWTVQTPQTFKVDLLRKAFAHIQENDITVTDEASAVELISDEVRLVETTDPNLKITTADDLPVAAAMLKLDSSINF
ncbi:MAG: 2-C-methyl-D-erythritol 4-phosphate cytidylyltransferase [Kiritimatiellae bacterium]|nr:2-C-methyl-D-erythritol 4-phosphate cytidylyltransferase [Kiritimatiellia bacterium]